MNRETEYIGLMNKASGSCSGGGLCMFVVAQGDTAACCQQSRRQQVGTTQALGLN